MLTDNLPEALDSLVSLGQTPDVNIRPVLLRVLVDMFVSKANHSREAVIQFEEIVSRLLDSADDAARLIVARKIAPHPLTPKALLQRMIGERGEIGDTILSNATLDSQTLQAAAALGTREMALAVARRSDVDVSVARALAERPELDILCALAENPAAAIDTNLNLYLVRRARESDTLAKALLARAGETREAAALFLAAGREQRLTILTAVRRRDLGQSGRFAPLPGAEEALVQIARAVLRPELEGLDLALGQAFGLAMPDLDRIIDDEGGEPLAVALAALGATPELAARVFILGHPAIGHSYQRVKALVAIVETLPTLSARRLMAAMAGARLPGRRPTSSPADRVAERHKFGMRSVRQADAISTISPAKKAG